MKKRIFSLFFLVCLLVGFARPEIKFKDHFFDAVMRIDYFQTGDSQNIHYSIDQIYRQEQWPGNPSKLIDTYNTGMYYIKVYELASNTLIYSRGFATIFGEYQTTNDAKAGINKTYHQTALIPFPRSSILFVVEGRDEKNILIPLFSIKIDPVNINIIQEKPDPNDKILSIMENGHPHDMIDVVFIAEGYTNEEEEKFQKDVERYTGILFQSEPFKSQKQRFNIRAVFRPSAESSVDKPTKGEFRNTVVDSAFNALDLPRYLLIDDNKSLRRIASRVPYDTVIIIANSQRYGGGGIYNDYIIFTSDHSRSPDVFMHEFGHGFGNLADEYFSSVVSYNEFFPPGVEPHESNITSLLDPKNVKWKHYLTPGIEIPTPWGQDEIAQLQSEKVTAVKKIEDKISYLKEKDEGSQEIKNLQEDLKKINKDYNIRIRQVRDKFRKIYQGKIGVFEGAGYSPKGLYRSEVHVGMFANGEYGKVSEEAILRQILHLSR